LSTTGWMFEHD